jgi:serine/threonine protein kinase
MSLPSGAHPPGAASLGGTNRNVSGEHEALPPGTRLSEFEIIRVLGMGGFGIVYLAVDTQLQRQVALKEYLPASMALRNP